MPHLPASSALQRFRVIDLTQVRAGAHRLPLTIMAGRAITREILKPSPELDAKLCTSLIRGCFSADYAEARTAFMRKRKPVFTGR